MKLSIITVVLNAAATIERTISSVITQEFAGELEYIVIDGGSTDGTLEILQRYKSAFAQLISESDHGLYDAMNKGLKLATGDLAGIINADDYYLPGAFQIITQAYSAAPQADKTVFWGDVQYELQGRVKGFRPHNVHIGAFAPHPSMFVPMAVYRSIGGYDTRFKLLADYDFMYRVYHCHHLNVVYIPKVLAFFSEGGLADSNVRRCLEEEYKIKVKNGGCRLIAWLLFHLKLVKNRHRL